MTDAFWTALAKLATNTEWVGICVFAAVFFRHNLRRAIDTLVDRVTEIGPQAAKFDIPQHQIAIPPNAEISLVETDVTSLKKELSPAVIEMRDRLLAGISGSSNINDANSMLDLAAQAITDFHNERTYHRIFASQLYVLRVLDTEDIALDNIQQYYEVNAARPEFSEFYKTYPFNKWFGFMLNTGLVKAVNGVISITPSGKEFLSYIKRNLLPEHHYW